MSRRRKRSSKRKKKRNKARYAADQRITAHQLNAEELAVQQSKGEAARKQVLTMAAPKQQVRVHIRWMIKGDMPEVLAIEHASFDFPWCEEDFLQVLRQRNCIGMVAELGERVVGFMIYELHETRLNVLDFAVHPEFRRQSVGKQMNDKLVGKLSSHRRTRIVTLVRETNLCAQIFWRELKWKAVEVIREHYQDTGEDAFVMHYCYDETRYEEYLQGPLPNSSTSRGYLP